MRFPTSMPKLTKVERRRLNQVLWAKRILREASPVMVEHAELLERLRAAAGLPERGAHHADPKGPSSA